MKTTECLVRLVRVPISGWKLGWRECRYPDGRILVQAFCMGPLELQWWPLRDGGHA